MTTVTQFSASTPVTFSEIWNSSSRRYSYVYSASPGVRSVFQYAPQVSSLTQVRQNIPAPEDLRHLTDAAILDHTNKPPVAVGIIKEHHGVAFGRICLAFDGCDKRMQGVDESEIDIL